jgi:hypothetical protein
MDFEKIEIVRVENDCFIVVYKNNQGHVLLNKKGEQLKFRHIRQAKGWLEQKFNINSLEVSIKSNNGTYVIAGEHKLNKNLKNNPLIQLKKWD